MPTIYLARHAQSTVNAGELAFGNRLAPLTPEGMGQVRYLRDKFLFSAGIVPERYRRPVLASEFVRTRDTAMATGFRQINQSALINESRLEEDVLRGMDVINRHRVTGWVPEETLDRARTFISLVREGGLEHEIFFTHGMFIASVLTELGDPNHQFNEKRGLIPLQASLTVVEL